jgi:hypothetical protein
VIEAMVECFEKYDPVEFLIRDAIPETPDLRGNADAKRVALPLYRIEETAFDVYGMNIAAQARKMDGKLPLTWTVFKNVGAGLYIECPKDMPVTDQILTDQAAL